MKMNLKNIFKQCLLLVLAPVFLLSCEQSDPSVLSYELVWNDEFDGTAVDQSKWTFLEGDGTEYGIPGWGNNELQIYTKNNARVKDGILTIEARKELFGADLKETYTSARMVTENKGDWKQGKFEARIKMNKTVGAWYAFWMLPSNPTEPWPVSGEIDIMEYVGYRPQEVLFNIHYQNVGGTHSNTGSTILQADTFDFNEFHDYTIEWDDFEIKWFVDGEELYSVLKTEAELSGVWPYNAPFHLILNLAIGGNLAGPNVDDSQFPCRMQVDYVRVYKLTN